MVLAAPQRYLSGITLSGPDREAVLLYNTAITALGDAALAIARDDIEGRCGAVWAATEAIPTLYLNLEVKQAGQLSDCLAELYGSILARLIEINADSDGAVAEDLIELLESLRDSPIEPDGMISADRSRADSVQPPAKDGSDAPNMRAALGRFSEARSPR